jgi:homoserine dehydrogenase
MDRTSIGVGLIGCGTVGTGVLRLLSHEDEIRARVGCSLRVHKIAVRDLEAERDDVVDKSLLTTSVSDVLTHPEIDVVVEVMGGIEPARRVVADALKHGKQVVTANKALLAAHGDVLLSYADQHDLDLMFEASVAGGIPVIRALRSSLASDRVQSIHGIINGTSNYVLTEVEQSGASLDEVVKEAQKLGYAEADPSADVDGFDAAAKLQILMCLAFGTSVTQATPEVRSIVPLCSIDFEYARSFGYRIKPLAVARKDGDQIEAWVGPALVPEEHVLAGVSGVYNACYLNSQAVGPLLFYGQGAGMMATAVSVVADVIDTSRNLIAGATGRRQPAAETGASILVVDSGRSARPHYLRLTVEDRPGVLGRIATALGAHQISIQSLVQDDHRPNTNAEIMILTHDVLGSDVMKAVAEIDRSADVRAATLVLPIEDPERA